MARTNNPVLGTIQCRECGQQATVHQTQRGKGRFLYTRCPECNADQRTGQTFQARLWRETDWREGANPVKPVCLEWYAGKGAEPDPAPGKAADEPAEPTEKAVRRPNPWVGLSALAAGALVIVGILGR